MTEEQRNQLMKLAGEMARGDGMPSPEVEDWDLPKSTPDRARREIRIAATLAGGQARGWAAAIRDIVERDRREATP